jgi:hypothetical protein
MIQNIHLNFKKVVLQMNTVSIDHYLDKRNITWNPQQPHRTALSSQGSLHTRPIFVGSQHTKQLNPALNQVIKTMQKETHCSIDKPDSHLCTD